MKQHELSIPTRGQGFVDITAQVNALLKGVEAGLCNVFIQHTSASLLIQENADPTVQKDLLRFFRALCDRGEYEHTDEGPDDMPGHVKAALLRTSETIPIRGGKLALGTWQALYLVEHRHASHTRRLVLTIYGQV